MTYKLINTKKKEPLSEREATVLTDNIIDFLEDIVKEHSVCYYGSLFAYTKNGGISTTIRMFPDDNPEVKKELIDRMKEDIKLLENEDI